MNHQAHGAHQAHQEGREPDSWLDDLAHAIVDAGLKVHKALGPGLLESTYEHCLAHEFALRNIVCLRQVALPIVYEGMQIEAGYRLDMVIEDAIIIEIKATETLTRLHSSQLLTYLKISGYRLGFLMNFNVSLFKEGLRRLIV